MLFLTKRMEDTRLRCSAADDSEVRIIVSLVKKLSLPSIHLADLMFNKAFALIPTFCYALLIRQHRFFACSS